MEDAIYITERQTEFKIHTSLAEAPRLFENDYVLLT